MEDHYLVAARFWSSLVGFAVLEVSCLQADFSASGRAYVTDVLVTSVLTQCNTMFDWHGMQFAFALTYAKRITYLVFMRIQCSDGFAV